MRNGTGRNGFGTHVYTNGDQWDGVWDGDKPHGAGLYIAYNNPDHKVKAGFIKQGDPIPTDGRGAIGSDELRKEDKIRIIQVLTLMRVPRLLDCVRREPGSPHARSSVPTQVYRRGWCRIFALVSPVRQTTRVC